MANTNTYIDKIVVPNGANTITASLVDSVSGYTKMFKVTLEYHNALNGQSSHYTVDKTYAEILAAYTAGDFVYLYDDTTTTAKNVVWLEAPLIAYNEDQGENGSFIFESHNQNGFICYEVFSDESVIVDTINLGGSSTDVQINNTSITSSGVANIVTNGTYNSSTNKVAVMSDVGIFEIPLYYSSGDYVTDVSWSDIADALDNGKLLYVSVDRNGDTYDAGSETYSSTIIYCTLIEAYGYYSNNPQLTFCGMSEEWEPVNPELFAVVILTPGSGDTVVVSLSYTNVAYATSAATATTATNANNINNSQFTNTSYVTYYLPFLNGYTAGNKKPYTHNGAALYTRVGTASAVGVAYLKLGNTTNSGTAGNMRGGIDLYAQSGAHYTRILTTNTLTADNTLTLPTGTGTVALTSDIPSVPNVLTGTSAPTSGQGSDGDIYIRY